MRLAISPPANLRLVGIVDMRGTSELLLEGVRDHVLHVLQFLLKVLQLVIIPIDGLLIGNILGLKSLLLDLSLFQLLS